MACAGVSQFAGEKRRLAGSDHGNHWPGGIGVWFPGIREPGLESTSRTGKFVNRLRLPGAFSDCGEARKCTDGSSRAISLFEFQRCESVDALTLCGAWHFLLFVSTQPDSSARLFCNCNRCGGAANDFAHVPSFAMVGRTGRTLWAEKASHRRSTHCGRWLSFVRSLLGECQLLDRPVSCFYCSGTGHGRKRSPVDNRSDEFRGN